MTIVLYTGYHITFDMYVPLEVVECIDTFSKIVITILFYIHEKHCYITNYGCIYKHV